MSIDTSALPMLAADRVGQVAGAVDLDGGAADHAHHIAEQADWEWGINRSPSALAAAAVWLAAIEYGESHTQRTVAAAADCSAVALREARDAIQSARDGGER